MPFPRISSKIRWFLKPIPGSYDSAHRYVAKKLQTGHRPPNFTLTRFVRPVPAKYVIVFRCCARNSHCSVFPQYISKQQHFIPALLPLLVIIKRCFFQWIYFRKILTSLWRPITLLVRMPPTRYLYIQKRIGLL